MLNLVLIILGYMCAGFYYHGCYHGFLYIFHPGLPLFSNCKPGLVQIMQASLHCVTNLMFTLGGFPPPVDPRSRSWQRFPHHCSIFLHQHWRSHKSGYNSLFNIIKCEASLFQRFILFWHLRLHLILVLFNNSQKRMGETLSAASVNTLAVALISIVIGNTTLLFRVSIWSRQMIYLIYCCLDCLPHRFNLWTWRYWGLLYPGWWRNVNYLSVSDLLWHFLSILNNHFRQPYVCSTPMLPCLLCSLPF